MSLLGHEITVNGLRCAMVTRGRENGAYTLTFEREFASLEQIEAVPWDNPTVEVVSALGTILPSGYGFEVTDIVYDYGPSCWKVSLAVSAQYLGDVTEYAAQIEQLQGQLETAQADAAAAQGDAAAAQATESEAQEILSIIVEGEDDEA